MAPETSWLLPTAFSALSFCHCTLGVPIYMSLIQSTQDSESYWLGEYAELLQHAGHLSSHWTTKESCLWDRCGIWQCHHNTLLDGLCLKTCFVSLTRNDCEHWRHVRCLVQNSATRPRSLTSQAAVLITSLGFKCCLEALVPPTPQKYFDHWSYRDWKSIIRDSLLSNDSLPFLEC